MADAEYMMNNYSTAQNQGCWDDYDDFEYQLKKWEKKNGPIEDYDFDTPRFNDDKDFSAYKCNDTTCANYEEDLLF